MEEIREFRVWALAAMLLCLLGAAEAQSGKHPANASSQTYVVSLGGHCSQAHKLQVNVGYPAAKKIQATGWEVSVALSPTECKLYCTYRRKSYPTPIELLTHMLPPVTTVQAYGVDGTSVTIAVVDPGGLSSSNAETRLISGPVDAGASSQRWQFSIASERFDADSLRTQVRLASLPQDFARPVAAAVPLRI